MTSYIEQPHQPLADKDTTLTPLWVIEALGPFDFDPCGYQGHPTARTINTRPTDGLSVDWFGSVWCNPPYSDPSRWLEKLADHGEGIALVLASTDTRWFQTAAKRASCILFPSGRPKFHRADGSFVTLMRASAFIGFGVTGTKLADCGIEGFAF